MRPGLQKMLPHCGMAENIGSQTTLVCSNQQCSGPLYKGVRQSVSKKAGPPAEPGPANKWLEVKKKEEREAALSICNRSHHGLLSSLCQWPSFMGNNSIENLSPPPGDPSAPVFLPGLAHSPQYLARSHAGLWILWEQHQGLFVLLCLLSLNDFLRSSSKRTYYKSLSSSPDRSSLRGSGQAVFAWGSSLINGNNGALNIFFSKTLAQEIWYLKINAGDVV